MQIAEAAGGPRAVHVELSRGPVPLLQRHVLVLFLRHSRWDDSSAVATRWPHARVTRTALSAASVNDGVGLNVMALTPVDSSSKRGTAHARRGVGAWLAHA